MRFYIPFVVTSKGRLLTCSDTPFAIGDETSVPNANKEAFAQLVESAVGADVASGIDTEYRRGIIPIDIDVTLLFAPLVIGATTTEPKDTVQEIAQNTAQEIPPLGNNLTKNALEVLKSRAKSSDISSYGGGTIDNLGTNLRADFDPQLRTLVGELTTENQAIILADLANAKIRIAQNWATNKETKCLLIPLDETSYLGSL